MAYLMHVKHRQTDSTEQGFLCGLLIPNMSTPEALSVPRELGALTNLLDEHIASLAYGSCSVQNAALQAAKHVFDTCTL